MRVKWKNTNNWWEKGGCKKGVVRVRDGEKDVFLQ